MNAARIYELTSRQRYLETHWNHFHPAAQDVRSAVLLRKLGCVGTGCTAILE